MNLQRSRIEAPDGHFASPTDLAHLQPFALGPIKVEPAGRRLVGTAGRAIVVEPLIMQVLVVLARTPGDTLSRDDLVSECWGRRIVGDDAVNRVISRLRRDLAAVADGAVRVRTITKVGYCLEIESASETACETAPQGEASAPPRPRKVVAGAAIGVLAALVAIGATFLRAPEQAIAMAIEPATGSADASAAKLASDLTGDVAALTGSMTRLTFVESGAAAPADLVLKVSYYERGAKGAGAARMRLVDSGNGAVIWTRDFAGNAELARERAAYAVAGVVRCGLDRSAGDLGDPVSKRLYFAACDAVDVRDWPRARSFAQQIVNRRPDSAASWACLAMTTIHADGTAPETRKEVARRSMDYARHALKLDPSSGLAHQALAMSLELQGRSGFAALEDGVRMDPEHGGLLARYAWGLLDLGYAEASVDPALRAMALEPGDFGVAMSAFYDLLGAGRLPEARRLAQRIERLWSGSHDVSAPHLELLFYSTDPKAALAQFDRAPSKNKANGEIMRRELVWRTAPQRFDWTGFDLMAERLYREEPTLAWNLAFSAARLRDKERAFAWLSRAGANTGNPLWFPMFWSDAAELRRDRRFFAKMHELGLVDAWRSRGRWPDFCADPALRYDCRREAARLAAAKVTYPPGD